MHTSPKISAILETKEKRPRSSHLASFDFAQDEDEFDVPATVYLILSVVEGRTAPVQMCACPGAFALSLRSSAHVASAMPCQIAIAWRVAATSWTRRIWTPCDNPWSAPASEPGRRSLGGAALLSAP